MGITKGEPYWEDQGWGSSAPVVAPRGPQKPTMAPLGTGLVCQPCIIAGPVSLLILALGSFSSSPMGLNKQSVMEVSGLPLCVLQAKYSPYIPETVLKLGTMPLIRIEFSKLQLQFGFVSWKLHSGPLDWSFEYSQSFQSHIYSLWVSFHRWLNSCIMYGFHRWCLRGQVYSWMFAGSYGHSHVLCTCVVLSLLGVGLSTLFKGNCPVSTVRVSVRESGCVFSFSPQFLNREGTEVLKLDQNSQNHKNSASKLKKLELWFSVFCSSAKSSYFWAI